MVSLYVGHTEVSKDKNPGQGNRSSSEDMQVYRERDDVTENGK